MPAPEPSTISERPARPEVFLHIGAMKTGTTYLQQLLGDNRDALRAAGVRYPGGTWSAHVDAARDALGSDEVATTPGSPRPWDALAHELLGHPGRSVFSMEFLSFADEQAARIVASLGGAEVHVVLTVRDAAVAVPAQWQTSCRMAGVVEFDRLIEAMARPSHARGRAARLLHRTQGIDRMLEVWTPLVGADHVHVVTVPPRGSDPSLLWQRFASVLGVDPQSCAAPTSYVHTSLGHASSEVLRRLNIELGKRQARSPQVRAVKRGLVRALHPHARSETPIVLHRHGRELAVQWNRRSREAVERHGVHVVGSLDDLALEPPGPEVPETLPVPGDDEILEAAEVALAHLRAERDRLAAWPGGGSVTENARPRHAQAAVRGLAILVRDCVKLETERGR